MEAWTNLDAIKLYHIDRWGDGYFDVSPSGDIMVRPKGEIGSPGFAIKEVADELLRRGVELPCILRFQDILRSRVQRLNRAFENAIREYQYQNRYLGVFPIKVNQLREVVEEILDAGASYHFGLEAGSKPELLATLAMMKDPESIIICNGYKDESFVTNALHGIKLGKKVILVVEKPAEIDLIINTSKKVGIAPLIGIRTKLYSKGGGKWESSGGDASKFGLTTIEVLDAVRKLETAGMKDSFQLLHFHLGSQLPDIRAVRSAVKECARLYSKMKKAGMNLQYIDVGGGLGIDYDGSNTNFHSSMNYTIQEYANDVVYTILEVCRNEGVKEPIIVSESGRALTAHHSVLLTDVKDIIEQGTPTFNPEFRTNEHHVVKELFDARENLSIKNVRETYNDAIHLRDEAFTLFSVGYLGLEERAKVEWLFWDICRRVTKIMKQFKEPPEELEALNRILGNKYICNFSVFQSVHDHWAIDHLFPIAPIHRLNERPTRLGTLADITCDSDGKIDKFIDIKDVQDVLPLHDVRTNEQYILGMFLMGAYQDILGDLHNLFGNLHEAHIFEDESGGFYIEKVIPGQSCEEVLSLVQYKQEDLMNTMAETVKERIASKKITEAEGRAALESYEKSLSGYTYLV